jgi:hypothetical protein
VTPLRNLALLENEKEGFFGSIENNFSNICNAGQASSYSILYVYKYNSVLAVSIKCFSFYQHGRCRGRKLEETVNAVLLLDLPKRSACTTSSFLGDRLKDGCGDEGSRIRSSGGERGHVEKVHHGLTVPIAPSGGADDPAGGRGRTSWRIFFTNQNVCRRSGRRNQII